MFKTLFSGRKKFVTIPTAVIFGLSSLAALAPHSPVGQTEPISVPVSTSVPTIALEPTIPLKPTAKPTVKYTVVNAQPISETGGFRCDCSKACTQISTCAEAQYQLKNCGCLQRDNDNDGIACDGKPLNCQK